MADLLSEYKLAWKYALVAMLLPLLCNCTPPTPETQLTWDANTASPRTSRHAAPRTYAYNEKPTARPVSNAPAHCSCDDVVTTKNLPPPGSAAPGSATFAWPLTGTVISTFGSDQSGARNDGINIAVKLGEPIHAAAGGNVIYAGNELKGYGNLILIKHSDGYVTAYAHAERLLVSRGESVTKGQVIAYAGQTGDVTSPQLHFEIRHDTQPVNPRPLLVASN